MQSSACACHVRCKWHSHLPGMHCRPNCCCNPLPSAACSTTAGREGRESGGAVDGRVGCLSMQMAPCSCGVHIGDVQALLLIVASPLSQIARPHCFDMTLYLGGRVTWWLCNCHTNTDTPALCWAAQQVGKVMAVVVIMRLPGGRCHFYAFQAPDTPPAWATQPSGGPSRRV
jgi:hypothetical protein